MPCRIPSAPFRSLFWKWAGDQYLRDACRIICDIFKHSPVFRIGGDEFAVIAQDEDYSHIEERITRLNEHNAGALRSEGIVIACGMARFENDTSTSAVLARADRNMYENKNRLKAGVIAKGADVRP